MNGSTLRLLLERLNAVSARAVEAAAAFAAARSDYEVQIEHVLLKLLEDDAETDLDRALAYFRVDPDRVWSALMESLSRGRSGNQGKPAFSPLLLQWLERALIAAELYYGSRELRGVALLDAALELGARLPANAVFAALEAVGLEALRSEHGRILAGSAEASPAQPAAAGAVVAGEALARYTQDFTGRAERGELDPVLGRADEIRRVVDILSRRRKNNPILVGEPGVGKTAVVEGLALRVADGDVPEALRGVRILGLDLGLLQAGASVKGEFERRMKQVIHEIKTSPRPVILFIDEAHTLIGAGGEAGLGDAANLLKPVLARGELRAIAATTFSEYKRYFERDAALERRFQQVSVDEPDEATAALMLSGLRQRYQDHHQVLITDAAVQAAVRLSSRYLAGRQLPDKAIDLLDTAAARVRMGQGCRPQELDAAHEHLLYLERRLAALAEERAHGLRVDEDLQRTLVGELVTTRGRVDALQADWQREQALLAQLTDYRAARRDGAAATAPDGELELLHAEVGPAAVASVVAEWTGVPVGRMLRDQAATLLALEERLAQRVAGQDPALAQLGHSLRAAQAGLTAAEAPLGVFLLAGPSGVGKTETARALAEELFGGERFLISINMSEYQEPHSVAQLKGSPPGYVGYGEGGVLTEAVRQRPYSVVLLDEVEKAHPDVLNLFYQVFDRGCMRDGEGREIDFRNTVIVLTSNLGAATLLELCAEEGEEAEAGAPGQDALAAAIRPQLLQRFPAALLARMQVVPYRPLHRDALRSVVALKLEAVAERLLAQHGMEMRLTPEVLEQIVAQCEVSDSGARYVGSLIEQRLLPGIARSLLGYLAAEDMPDCLTLELNEAGELCCAFADLQPDAAVA